MIGAISARFGWLVAVASCLGAASARQAASPHREVTVVASLAPLAGIAKDLAPPGARIETLIPPGASEHGYDMPPSKLAVLASADVVIYVGMGLEPQVEKYLKEHPRAGRQEVCFATVVGESGATGDHDHDHAGGADHDHHGADPHLWLDPAMMKQLAVAASAALATASPGSAAEQEAGAARLQSVVGRIESVDAAYREAVSAAKRRTIVVGHDAFGRLAARYGLETIAIAGLTASEPTPSAIAAVSAAARDKGVTTIFVEPQQSQAVGRRLAQVCNLRVLVLDPLGGGDWFKLMSTNLEQIKAALGVTTSPQPK